MTSDPTSPGGGDQEPRAALPAGLSALPQADGDRPEIPLFGVKLSLFLVAEQGCRLAAPREALPYVGNIDIPCFSVEGGLYTLTLIVDGETDPSKELSSTATELRAMSDALSVRLGEQRIRPRIHVVEVGSGASWSAETRWADIKVKYADSLAIVKMSVVDPERREVFSNSAEHEAYLRSVLARPVPTKAELAAAIAAQKRPSSQPWLAGVLIAGLFAIFALEIQFGVGPTLKALTPNVQTLVAFGGVGRELVVGPGDWSRLLTAMFLHGDPKHLLFNAYGLLAGGVLLEGRIGRWHFLAMYLLSGISGALASIGLNPANVVSVGASGAIAGLFGGVIVLAQHYPPGPARFAIQRRSLQILIPSILPLVFTVFSASKHIDFGAHLGGAIAGALYGWMLMGVWPQRQILPGLTGVAGVVVALTAAALAASLPGKVVEIRDLARDSVIAVPEPQQPAPPNRSASPLRFPPAVPTALPPRPGIETSPDALRTDINFNAIRDQINGASDLIVDGKYWAAEQDLRDALSHELVLRQSPLRPMVPFARAMLALALAGQHRDAEARLEAEPLCATTEAIRQLLRDRRLCD